MFNSDFYPTPINVIEQMLFGVDIKGKVVLEPSSGKCDIVDYLKLHEAKQVLCCEINKDLALISSTKANLIAYDFLQAQKEDISHIDLIVMNPPFSKDEQHILHAWNIAPEGCQIIALCNWQTLENRYSYCRKELNEIVVKNGTKENIGNCFSDAERETDVEIGLIKLFKPRTSEDTEFNGYFDLSEGYEREENGVMRFDEIKSIVNRYVAAVKMFNEVVESSKKMNDLISPINVNSNIVFGAFEKSEKRSFELSMIDRDTFKKNLQKAAWKTIFGKMKMDKYVTQSVMSDINKFCEQQTNVPFTCNNIYKMIEMIVGTQKQRMERVLTEAFDKICSYARENSDAGNERDSWKTNSNYKVNRNFIKPYITEVGWHGEFKIRFGASDELDDINKALCYLTGSNFDNMLSIQNYFSCRYKLKTKEGIVKGYNNISNSFEEIKRQQRALEKEGIKTEIEDSGIFEFGKWYEYGFFKFKGFKKGTGHFMFLDEKVWERFNYEVARIKGWRLPTQTDNKKTGKERTKKQGLEKIQHENIY